MRASLSAPLNIVEGHGRGTVRDFLKFLETASSSLNEVEYLLDFLVRKNVITQDEYDSAESRRAEAAAVLHGLIKALRAKLEEVQTNGKGTSVRGMSSISPAGHWKMSNSGY